VGVSVADLIENQAAISKPYILFTVGIERNQLCFKPIIANVVENLTTALAMVIQAIVTGNFQYSYGLVIPEAPQKQNILPIVHFLSNFSLLKIAPVTTPTP
jgi:hypothetical protein